MRARAQLFSQLSTSQRVCVCVCVCARARAREHVNFPFVLRSSGIVLFLPQSVSVVESGWILTEFSQTGARATVEA